MDDGGILAVERFVQLGRFIMPPRGPAGMVRVINCPGYCHWGTVPVTQPPPFDFLKHGPFLIRLRGPRQIALKMNQTARQ